MKNISLILFTLLSVSSLKCMDKKFDELSVSLTQAVYGTPSDFMFRPIKRRSVRREHSPQWYRELYYGKEQDCGVDSPTTPNGVTVPTPPATPEPSK